MSDDSDSDIDTSSTSSFRTSSSQCSSSSGSDDETSSDLDFTSSTTSSENFTLESDNDLKLKSVFVHHKSTVSGILVFEKYGLFATSSFDKSVKIGNILSGDIIRTFFLGDWVNDIIHWNGDELFIAGTDNGEVVECNVRNYEERRIFTDDDCSINRLAKIDDDTIVCIDDGNENVIMVNYTSGIVLDTVDGVIECDFSSLATSKLFPKVFYVNWDCERSPRSKNKYDVSMLKCTKEKMVVEEEFFPFDKERGISCIGVMNTDDREFLISGYSDGEVNIIDPRMKPSLVRKIDFLPQKPRLSFCLPLHYKHHTFSVLGDEKGYVYLIDMGDILKKSTSEKYEEQILLFRKRVHSSCINCILLVSSDTEVKIMTSSGENSMKYFSIEHLKKIVPKDTDQEDRTNFLKNEYLVRNRFFGVMDIKIGFGSIVCAFSFYKTFLNM